MRFSLFIVLMFFIGGCAQLNKEKNSSLWDFDHEVRYQQNEISKGVYSVKVLRYNDTHFAQLATFLVRHAYNLCQGYDYSLKIIDGVETVDDKKARPNWIPPSLSAKVECAVE